MTIRAVITDDEPSGRASVRALLSREPDVEIVAECSDGLETLRAIEALSPDLLFLDVQLPVLGGLDALARARHGRLPVVVLVTAHEQYARRAFDLHAADYLVKPYSDGRFRMALERARARLEHQSLRELRMKVVELAAHTSESPRPARSAPLDRYLEYLTLGAGNRVMIVRVDEVDWIEAAGDYVRVHTGGRALLLRSTMQAMEARLDPSQFVRLHRSTIVRLGAMLELRRTGDDEYAAVLRDGVTRPVSERGRDCLSRALRLRV